MFFFNDLFLLFESILMRKNPITLFKHLLVAVWMLLIVLSTACKKNNDIDTPVTDDPVVPGDTTVVGDSTKAGLKLKLVGGGGQTDTVGQSLKEPILVKLTQDGHIPGAFTIRFDTYDCDNNKIIRAQEYYHPGTYTKEPPDSVTVSFSWELNGIIGTQYAKVTVWDSLKRPQDSLTITATGVKASEKGWHKSGCSPQGYSVAFAQLSSGRILSATNTFDSFNSYIYYSDDEGVTWTRMKTSPNIKNYARMVTTPSNEMFLSAYYKSVYYSKDGGLTWETRNNIPTYASTGDVYYTQSGILFWAYLGTAYLSNDKGLNWRQINTPNPYLSKFSDPVSLKDGTLFAKHFEALVISTDGGDNWTKLWTLDKDTAITSVYVDDNDYVFVGCSSKTVGAGLYVSKDRGQTWNYIYPTQYNGVFKINKFNGVYYFYARNEHELISTTDLVTFTRIDPVRSDDYFVTKNNHLILSTSNGFQYYVP
ncbi:MULTISPECIES: WD40/YVTN/BNR-like repeat-containing protein [Niastella]|uniref:Exo-alpha-sialidase n=1 Tax=Niastella soli TaxID=2821487 RepID=A0ABS3YM01_9BACT|nr:sialidase family protein [Niastella soli]MBO9198908.1 exo-alpha-sialidase [Niastella soli]